MVGDCFDALTKHFTATSRRRVIDGRVRVRDGQLVDIDLPPLIARHNALARALVRGERQ